jgi:hypothetical protein
MDSDTNDSAKDVQESMAEEADRMEARLDELGEQVKDADAKAEVPRGLAGSGGGAVAQAVGGESEEGGAEDDPAAAFNQPAEADADGTAETED